MTKKYLKKITIIISLCSLFSVLKIQQLSAQVFPSTSIDVQQIKFLSVSALRSWFSNLGAEIEYGRRDRTAFLTVDQIDGLCWPNEYNVRMKGIKCDKGLWIGATNFLDPVTNSTYNCKVVCAGPRKLFSGYEIFGDDFWMSGKSNHPLVLVDGIPGSARDADDFVDKIDGSLTPDRMIYSTFHTSMGISVTRKILAFSQQYNDNYYIYEYTFKNSGIYDRSGKTVNNTMTGVYFFFDNRSGFAGESYFGILNNAGWFPSTTSWGRNTINDAVGQDATHALPAPNNFRACFQYWGPSNTSTVETAFGAVSDIGLPGPSSTNVWILAGSQFGGQVTLHADTSPSDTTDDPTQPSTTYIRGCDTGAPDPSQYSEATMDTKYNIMTIGHPALTQADEIGKDPIGGWPTAIANTYSCGTQFIGSNDAGGYSGTEGYGPYTMKPGDSVRIVIADCVAGINREKALEVAQNWFANNSNSSMALPAGYAAKKGAPTTTNRDEYKAAWVFSGKDSLFQTFRRAIANYKSGYAISQPPPPPDNFNVLGGGNEILLSWSKNAESYPHFNGYRVYRAQDRPDTSYALIFECDKNNIVNTYEDKNPKRGFNYYYYIQSKDDGTTNPGDAILGIPAGEPLVSSKYYTMTINPASLTRSPGAPLVSDTSLITVQFIEDSSKVKFVLPMSISMYDVTDTLNQWIVQHWSDDVRVQGVKQSASTSYTVLKDTAKITAKHAVKQDTLVFNTAPPNGDTIVVRIYSLYTGKFVEDSTETKFVLPVSMSDTLGTPLHWVQVNIQGVKQIPPSYVIMKDAGKITAKHTMQRDTLEFLRAPAKDDTIQIKIFSYSYTNDSSSAPPQIKRNYSLSQIKIVPNPWNINARNIQFGTNDPDTKDQLEFYNLPPKCKISIFTETGDLVTTIDHINTTGDQKWNLTTSSRQIIVSGIYIAYFEVTEDDPPRYNKGDHIIKKFVIIR